ncbi:MAG: hypothetical protein GF411_01760 [Candidatus Lokiarchaeota archaeon]|nr:hypothetical protein [Candidatus Lokiarchaeota archaeon]
MAKELDRFQPTLLEWPAQNNRTGWHPVWTSTLLVVPWSFDVNGNRISNSQIKSVTFAIERPIQIRVAGHPQSYAPLGLKPAADPDAIIFEITLSYEQLLEYRIDPSDYTIYDQETGESIEDPEEGDWIEYDSSRGIRSRVEYLPDAEYFDLSSIEINVDNLPSGRYIASWIVEYCERIKTDDILFCISDNILKNKLDYPINHPGEIHEEMVKRTPALYIQDTDRKQDFTVNLYRPFADILQDIFDETELLHGINWISRIPPQLFPYLSYLIGIELPTRSGIQNIDKIRRNMLERGVELQRLKGSELAIKELFSILGFTVELINLWVGSDGNRFFAPNEPDPNPRVTPQDEIISSVVSQTDPLAANYDESGFGDFEVPLLFHNKDSQIVLSAYVVENNSQSHEDLTVIINNLVDDPNYLTKDTIVNYSDGYLMLPQEVLSIDDGGIESYARLVISDIEVLSQEHIGSPVLRFDGVQYDILKDKLNITFANYKDLSNSTLYVFATYGRDKITVPDHLINNQTNRFDVKITSKVGDIEPGLYDYLIDSLFKFKAFHSLLRKISYDAELRDFYNVTDFCNNSFLSQQRDSDANALMIPPACPATECFITDECNEQNARGGLRESDNKVRNIILEGLREEYDRWHDVTTEWLDISETRQDDIEWARSVSNITIPIPDNAGDNFGQDRVSYDLIVEVDDSTPATLDMGSRIDMTYMGTYLESVPSSGTESIKLNIRTTKYQILSNIAGVGVVIEVVRKINTDVYYISMLVDVDHQLDIRSKITELDRLNTPDYCYKGRVRDFLNLEIDIQPKTIVRNKPCNLMQGLGIYYTINTGTLDNIRGWYNDRLTNSDQSLHYSNTLFFRNLYMGSHLRPSIEIEKIGMGFSRHRQIRGGLLSDFTHPHYKSRPWDINDECFDLINPLNAKIISNIESDGTINEQLVFDEEDLTYEANLIKPDIPYYSGESDVEFTHSVYSTTEERSFVELDNVVYSSDSDISIDSPSFDSARQCSNTDGYLDYRDGYPSSVGELTFDVSAITAERVMDGNLVIESDLDSTASIEAAGTYSSEIFMSKPEESGTINTYNGYETWRGYRYDCDCAEYLCTDDRRNCNFDFFKNDRGEYDFNNDHVEIDYVASLVETISGKNYSHDGKISDWLNWEFEETGPNEFEFKDEYDIQYRITFEENLEVLDITYETFQPRIWGEESDGYVANGKVFRKGILTTIRQIFILQNGGWVLNAEGTEQEVTYRQTNYDCEWPTPADRFTHRYEYLLQDEVKMATICGPHWTDPNNEDDIYIVWSEDENVREWDEGIWDVGFWDFDFVGESTGELTGGICSISPFQFIDVWESYDTDNNMLPAKVS